MVSKSKNNQMNPSPSPNPPNTAGGVTSTEAKSIGPTSTSPKSHGIVNNLTEEILRLLVESLKNAALSSPSSMPLGTSNSHDSSVPTASPPKTPSIKSLSAPSGSMNPPK